METRVPARPGSHYRRRASDRAYRGTHQSTGKKRLAEALRAGDLSVVREEALAQVAAGADILDVNVGATGVDEMDMLPRAVEAMAGVVDVPLCIEAARSKPSRRHCRLPGQAYRQFRDRRRGIPAGGPAPGQGVWPAGDRSHSGREGDPRGGVGQGGDRPPYRGEGGGARDPARGRHHRLPYPIVGGQRQGGPGHPGGDPAGAGRAGCQPDPGRSNISHGLPNRPALTSAYLAMAIEAGLTCPTVDVALVRLAILSADMVLGRDKYAMRFIEAFREAQAAQAGA